MNNIFNLKRFAKYLLYDIRTAWNNTSWSTLVIGLLPVLAFTLSTVFVFLVTGDIPDYTVADKVTIFTAAVVATMVAFPVKIYGAITDKRYGSSWLMVPASSLEKTLSMLIVVCVVLPVFVGGLFCISDGLLSLLFKNTYGGSVLATIHQTSKAVLEETSGYIRINLLGNGYLGWCISALTFTLGGIFFKKGKVAKTILSIFAITMILSIVAVRAVSNGWSLEFDFEKFFMDGNEEMILSLMRKVKALLISANVVLLLAVSGGIFARIKTLKH